jgi:hypothetical protein
MLLLFFQINKSIFISNIEKFTKKSNPARQKVLEYSSKLSEAKKQAVEINEFHIILLQTKDKEYYI